ncbi:MAG: tryptophan 7-halogenase [Vicinamibacterales bacterium]
MSLDSPAGSRVDDDLARRGEVDVAVIGGGPAGATTARLLSLWGHRVTLFDKPARASLALVESLPPSIRKLLAYVGIADRVERAGFPPSRGNTCWWADVERRVEPFVTPIGVDGFQVPRAAFDALLVSAAREVGVTMAGAVERVVLPEASKAGRERGRPVEGVAVHADGAVTRARFVVDASGRAGVVARLGWRAEALGPRTHAVAGIWESAAGFRLPDWTHTVIESFDAGWVWSVPFDAHRRQVTVMVDAERADHGGGVERAYGAAFARTREMARLLEGATLVGRPFVRDATVMRSERASFESGVLVGDAAGSIDPISSIGVKKAMTSGWRAAAALHTCLVDPSRAGLALSYHAEREQVVFTACLAEAVGFFSQANDRYRHAFWGARVDAWGRAVAGATLDVESALGASDRALLQDPAVAEAWQQLQASQSLKLRQASRVQRVARPTISGREVVLEDTLVGPAVPDGVRFVGRVNLPKLAALASDYDGVPELFGAYTSRVEPVSFPDFVRALSVLLGKGLVECL